MLAFIAWLKPVRRHRRHIEIRIAIARTIPSPQGAAFVPHFVQNFAPAASGDPQLVQNLACGAGAAGAAGGAGRGWAVGVAAEGGAGTPGSLEMRAASKVTAVAVPALIHSVSSNARPA
jgi:hypothetical protein